LRFFYFDWLIWCFVNFLYVFGLSLLCRIDPICIFVFFTFGVLNILFWWPSGVSIQNCKSKVFLRICDTFFFSKATFFYWFIWSFKEDDQSLTGHKKPFYTLFSNFRKNTLTIYNLPWAIHFLFHIFFCFVQKGTFGFQAIVICFF
jgi:hypothetical protein